MASAQLRDTRRRISSIEATQKITRAMELIAASRIPRAQARVIGSKPYTEKLIEVIKSVGATGTETSHALLMRREPRTIAMLVVASDRGLAGAYASNIIRLAEARIAAISVQGKDVLIYAVGRKAQSYFRYRGYRIEQAYLGVTDTPGYGDARAIARTVMAAYGDERIDAVEAFFTRFVSAMTQTPTGIELLPVTPPTAETKEGPTATYGFEPSPEEILDRLLPTYVEAIVFNMLLEASASEHSARRRAMKAATDNAEELIKSLRVQANRARQAEITTAITEIVGGAEALAEGR
ncbi:MAG: F0F1 ATP synthase subunit gamma [Actinobacteria bacterium]|nr:F0F1 ATP synthase subunit gamma [Actinomycetota bacterium]MCI0678387.1 F0F1 ATP synthase subunit gamma [Actinomycetota bacterium]